MHRSMLSKSFKPAKCKTSLKLAVARMKLLKNKRDIQLKQMKRDLAQLLESGQEQTARIRVEHVVREEKTMAAYEILELYCELIVARLPIIESQKNCPIDLKEAIASVIFAAPRCADVPELQDIRKHLTAKYGKDFAAAALELRPDCGVSRMVVEKLSATTPDGETKIKILTAIAKEHNVNWDPLALREEIAKPAEDLLKVPSRPENSAKTFVESSNVQYPNSEGQFKFSNEQFLARPGQKLDPSSTFTGSDGIRSSPGPNTFSSLDSKPPSFSVHSSYSQEGFSESKVASEGSKSSTYVGDSKSADGENWNMRFKDATSAAQAAAESAELASLAARAAAELSSRGKLTNDHSRTVTDSPYDMTKDEVSPSARNPKSSSTRSSFKKNGDPEVYHEEMISKRSNQQRDETYWSNLSDGSDNRHNAMENKSSSLKKSGLSSPADMLSGDEVSPTTRNSKSSSSRSSFKKSGDPEVYHVGEILKKNDQGRDETSWYNLSHGDESRSDVTWSRNSSVREAALSQPADMFSNDDAPVIDLQKAGGSFMDTGSGSNRNDIGSPHSTTNFVRMNSSPRPDIKDYDSDIFGENSRDPFGESSFNKRSKRWSNDYSAVLFDDSGSEGEEKLDLEDINGTGRFPAHISTDEGYSLSHSGSWNFNEHNASPLANSSTDNSHIMGAKHTTKNSVELLRNSDQSQQSDFPAATYDSDGHLSSSSDDEVDIHKLEERNKSGDYSYKLDRSDQLTSAGSVHEPIKFEDENRQFKEAHRNMHGPYSYDDSDSKNDAVDVSFKQDLLKPLQKHDSGNILRERSHFEDTKGIDNLAVEEHQMTSIPSPSAGKTFDMLGVDLQDKVSDEVKVLNFSSDENEMRLNFGRLTGGLRHKNFIQPPYVKHPSKQRTTDNTSVESQSVDFGGRRLKSTKGPSMELPSEKSHEEVVRETKQETAYKTSVESQAVDFGGRTPKYSEATVAQLSRENSPKEVNEESKQGAIDKTFVESQTVNFGGRTPRNTKAPVLELPSEKPREVVVKESKHTKAFNFFDSDSSDDDKKQEPQKTMNSKAYNDNAFSRRTKALPSKTEAGSPSRFTSHIRTQHENSGEASSISDRKTNVVRSKGRGIRSTEGIFSVEQSSKRPSSEDPSLMAKERVNPRPEIPKRGAPKSSKLSSLIGESSSVDNSPKLAGHVHPKLPDYDTLAARIQSLTSNKR